MYRNTKKKILGTFVEKFSKKILGTFVEKFSHKSLCLLDSYKNFLQQNLITSLRATFKERKRARNRVKLLDEAIFPLHYTKNVTLHFNVKSLSLDSKTTRGVLLLKFSTALQLITAFPF
jgi:hypothetical protein